MQEIYTGLQIESPQPLAVPKIYLTARIIDSIHFVFVPEKWESELKPFAKAKWRHDKHPAYGLHAYEIKQGVFLVFPQSQMTSGGLYAAQLYLVVKAMCANQAQGTLTVEGLTLETIEGFPPQKVVLKPRYLSKQDTPCQIVMRY